MLILMTGGSASGKSAHAEQILCAHAQGARLYLATMEPFGAEAEMRIERHHNMRAGRGFETIECYRNLGRMALAKKYDGVLLEDLGNLLANELFSTEGAGGDVERTILNGIAQLQTKCNTLVIVTNEIFADGLSYDAETIRYIEALGRLNTALAERANAVFESVCGILITLKGEKKT